MTDTHSFATLLSVLVAIILATKAFGEIAQRLGQPSVLGELIAGIALGGSLLGLLDPGDATIQALAELGVLVLLFEIGLHTDVRSLARVGGSAATVALVGVVLLFALGYWVAGALGLPPLAAIVAGAALTATSIGISARVLSDLGQLNTAEGQIVLGAAILDDVIGLIILSVIATMAAGGVVTAGSITRTSIIAAGFIVGAIVIGKLMMPLLYRLKIRITVSGALGTMSLAFAFLLAWLAEQVGSAMIIGAFAAGLILFSTPHRQQIEKSTTTIGHFFVPIFFASVGARIDLRALTDSRVLMLGGAITVVAIIGKLAAGFSPWWFKGRKLLIGTAMVPRGEVGLIFAQMGIASAALTPPQFSAITMMVMITTFMVPPLLALQIRAADRRPPGDWRGDGGIDDLVAGTRELPILSHSMPSDLMQEPDAVPGSPHGIDLTTTSRPPL